MPAGSSVSAGALHIGPDLLDPADWIFVFARWELRTSQEVTVRTRDQHHWHSVYFALVVGLNPLSGTGWYFVIAAELVKSDQFRTGLGKWQPAHVLGGTALALG